MKTYQGKVAISGLNNTDNPAPGIPVIKSLNDRYSLVGLSYDPNEPGNYQKLVDKTYLMPYPSLGFEELHSRLLYLKERENITAIIPNLDAELPLYIKYQNEIKDMGIELCLPSVENFELRDKNRLDKLSESLDILYPKTYEINSIDALEKIIEDKDLDFPLMIKGNYYKAYKVHNLDAAKKAFADISDEWGLPILAQKVVEGEEINLVGVADGKGELKGAVSIKKLTTTDIGKIWTAITIQNEKLLQIAKDFADQTNWRGPFELECMVNTNHIYLIEINPRFPAWVYFATQLGINLPQMVMDIIEERDIEPSFDYAANKMYVRVVDEFVTDFSDFMQLIATNEL